MEVTCANPYVKCGFLFVSQQRQSSQSKLQIRERELEKSKISVKLTEMRMSIEELVKAEQFTEVQQKYVTPVLALCPVSMHEIASTCSANIIKR